VPVERAVDLEAHAAAVAPAGESEFGHESEPRRTRPNDDRYAPAVPAAGDYEYELRRDGAVIATGRLQLEDPPSPGDELALGSKRALVEDVLPLRGGKRLILEQA
jgi:hypothetical protein